MQQKKHNYLIGVAQVDGFLGLSHITADSYSERDLNPLTTGALQRFLETWKESNPVELKTSLVPQFLVIR